MSITIDDEFLGGKIENAIAIIECAFQNAFDNNDASELEDEINRGIDELFMARDEAIAAIEGGAS